MKRIFLLIFFLLIISGCGKKGPYSEYREYLREIAALQNVFIESLEKSSKAEDVARAITIYGNGIITLSARGEAIKKKYPQLKDMNEPPAELADEFVKLNDNAERIAEVTAGIRPEYLADETVLKASMELARKLQEARLTETP